MEESIRTGLAAQVKAIRGDEDQATFARRIGKSQSWVSRLEDPNESPPTIPSLLNIASKLDIAIQVRFISFSDLLDSAIDLSPEKLFVPSFKKDVRPPRKGPISETQLTLSYIPQLKISSLFGSVPGTIDEHVYVPEDHRQADHPVILYGRSKRTAI